MKKSDLDFWVENNLNVLFIGEKGVGKSSIVLDTFKRHNLKFKYYSAATLDPWVDFIGIPKEKIDEYGTPYIELVKPKDWAYDEIECIFLDEYNRSKPKIRNAVMELIQFKSINGKRFDKLRFIWAAINPDDDNNTYDVERLDDAQKDRFQIHVEVPYEIDFNYFKEKYGEDNAKAAASYWAQINDDKLKKLLSPRRLDYALQVFAAGGNIRHVIPKECGPTKLLEYLKHGDYLEKVKKLIAEGEVQALVKLLQNKNVLAAIEPYIEKDSSLRNGVLCHLPAEELTSLVKKYDKVQQAVYHDLSSKKDTSLFYKAMSDYAHNSKNVQKAFSQIIGEIDALVASGNGSSNRQPSNDSDFEKAFVSQIEKNDFANATCAMYNASLAPDINDVFKRGLRVANFSQPATMISGQHHALGAIMKNVYKKLQVKPPMPIEWQQSTKVKFWEWMTT